MDDGAGHSWFEPPLGVNEPDVQEGLGEFVRLWRGFMTARLTLGVVLVLLQATLLTTTSSSHHFALIGISLGYFFSALVARLYASPRPLGKVFNSAWLGLVGFDVMVFMTLQALQGQSINYTPLCALPILLTSVLGTLRLALGTAAGVTMLLLAGTFLAYLETAGEFAPQLAQSALSGVGYFAIALLSNQLSTRLVKESVRARTSQLAARIQRQVNELVIESLPDGVLIVDNKGCVRAANPAARKLLGSQRAMHAAIFFLREEPGWQPLLELSRLSIGTGESREKDVAIHPEGRGPHRVRVRTRLATTQGHDGESLCVLFLQDLRELEARMRTEKLAAMGRMSTAVAHEIRNPLAAITQANALLEEDIVEPRLRKLTQMVHQNASRLDRIVDDILKVSRIQPLERQESRDVNVYALSRQICQDWSAQSGAGVRLSIHLPQETVLVQFDPDHLHRVLVNLLDNARRYTTTGVDAIQVHGIDIDERQVTLAVWSDGAPMDQSIERHLFEPFFSSESRSSGLGLYICRELCTRHGATLAYQRSTRGARQQSMEGNEFVIAFTRAESTQTSTASKLSTAL
jgi:two-component system sensor histidine kinase PilS (NtrC family)